MILRQSGKSEMIAAISIASFDVCVVYAMVAYCCCVYLFYICIALAIMRIYIYAHNHSFARHFLIHFRIEEWDEGISLHCRHHCKPAEIKYIAQIR